ncbi:putative CRM domain-containing protein [Citrus sinensis]|uniref:CRM domain-containing protein n=1 Tax=Citrus sinensis TaxID=2711 RepID=A0ACB8N881_CITSI|nr:putative CRM domain-containing protein [Citrus sinensis]
MVGRVLVSSASMALRKSPQFKILLSKFHIFKPFSYNKYPLQRIRLKLVYICKFGICMRLRLHCSSMVDVLCKAFGPCYGLKRFSIEGRLWIHSAPLRHYIEKVVEKQESSENSSSADGAGVAKVKRKKLKGKRAVVRWLKHFRCLGSILLLVLFQARKKEERIVEGLKKIEPKESSEMTHDPEILTPEEHFYFLKMGRKCKNYVPVGRRGIYQGVILNMHLHWKKHQTLKVIVKTFSAEEVKEIAAELARLTGGIVLEIHEENTIIMYRGKNYAQPPTEIMSPRITLSRKKALDKSKYRDGLRAVKKYIPKLEQELELLRAQAETRSENRSDAAEDVQNTELDKPDFGSIPSMMECSENDPTTESLMASDSEDLSDIFETDSETETEEKAELRPLYLDQFDKFPVQNDEEHEDFEEHLRQISIDSRNAKSLGKDEDSSHFDEVDKMFLRAASLLKKQKR